LLDCRFRKRLPEFELDVDLTIRVQTLALVGRSGAGKSTLLNVIAGLTRPDAGSVSLDGDALVHVGSKVDVPPERRKIGYLFQHYALFPHLSVRDNIGYGLFRVDAMTRAERIERAISFLGLGRIAQARTTELSGGERQRVALARALVTEPRCVLADEPTGNLDRGNAEAVFELMLELNRANGTALVIVTHDADLAARTDRTLHLVDGVLR
jgi:lipoprotein-releasing system ATP-binding protein